jgi:predicted nuclease of predicted toxin-antitoxin system
MKILIDENLSNRRLAGRLHAAGHDVELAGDAGLLSASDPRALIWAVGEDRCVLTQDYEDFTDLHDLIMACGGRHPGLLIICFDQDPRRNLTDRGIVAALKNLESSGVPISSQLHVLNHWR